MPFAREFDDVYATIKASVEWASQDGAVRCFRLDESRPAGRITDRLLQEIHAASLCIADLTGGKPNVMWEVGYAMALGKPTIIITQEKGELPFDIRVMETVRYDRNHLSESLGEPLRRSTIDTMALQLSASKTENNSESAIQSELVGELLTQIRDLKNIVQQAVATWNPTHGQGSTNTTLRHDIKTFEGAWVDRLSGTHLYARVIDGDLVVPYCFRGDDRLSSAFYGWKRVGEFWFARFRWFTTDLTGFVFLKDESSDLLTGGWWTSDDSEMMDIPDFGSGISARLERRSKTQFPDWALRFLEEVQRDGVAKRLCS
jgi:nucleoside 2-deoxyribosyltransferase